MNPTFMNIDSDFNKQYYQKGTTKNFEKYFERTNIPPTKGCSTYLISNINGKGGVYGSGNNAQRTINLVRLSI
jgi:ribonucleoside-triphosphate reductase